MSFGGVEGFAAPPNMPEEMQVWFAQVISEMRKAFENVPVYSDTTRPSAGQVGRVIFNTTDGQLNIDDGTNWTLPDGTTT